MRQATRIVSNSPFYICAVLIIATLSMAFTPKNAYAQFYPFRRNVDANANKIYGLTDKQGPWLIVCASFAGEMGKIQARDLVYELRKEFNLEAYMFQKEIDNTGKIKGIGYKDGASDRFDRPIPVEMRALHAQRFVETAVVVGNFPSADDKNAQTTLEKIKHIHPKTLFVSAEVETSQRMGVFREWVKAISPNQEIKKMGPMRAAFITPNPFIPDEYFEAHGLDKFVYDMNKNVEYSLLKCRGKYSVRVATFRGMSTFERNKMEREEKLFEYQKKNDGHIKGSKLEKAFVDAHRLTVELRKKGIEAYEFHDRFESYVCVGSFEWLFETDQYGNVRKGFDGKPVTNQQVAKTILDFKATMPTQSFPGVPAQLRPKTLPSLRGTGITFDLQPVPVIVPKGPEGFWNR